MAPFSSSISPIWWSTKAAICCSAGLDPRSDSGEEPFCNGWCRCCWRHISSAQRQTTAFAFCSFFFFENWLYTATYMADARAMLLPLVTAGDSDFIEHDWHTIFSSLGVLQYDTKIAAVVSFLGWCGMLGTVVWLVRRSLKDSVTETTTRSSGALARLYRIRKPV